jgi:hypothetical protein
MSLFYDSKKRTTKMWVIIAFILIPILLIAFLFLSTRGIVEKHKSMKTKEESSDIFS